MCGELAIVKGDLLVVLTSGFKYLYQRRKTKTCDNKNILFIRMPFVLTFPWQVILFLAANVQRQQQPARARRRGGTRPHPLEKDV